jgi:signal transduction histidine kinase
MPKEKESLELRQANEQLAFQNEEKEKRAAELLIANRELIYQNEEKEKRAAELAIANKELAIQNEEKEKLAAELLITNKELAFQIEEKEKQAEELKIANNELLAFTYISSHDLQEPLRKIQMFASIILEKDIESLSETAKYNFERMQLSAARMQRLIEDLLAFSRITTSDHVFEETDLNAIVQDVISDLSEVIKEKNATIEIPGLCPAKIIAFQFRQLMYNLVSNALKFASPDRSPHIVISCSIIKGDPLKHEKLSPEKNYCHVSVSDNGIGFEDHFNELVFELFQKLHRTEDYKGTGIGLAIVKKIVVNHKGIIMASGELGKGARFDIYLPA